MYPGKFFGGPCRILELRSGLYEPPRACIRMLEAACVPTVSTARSKGLKSVCIRDLLSPLLFILMLEALSCQFRTGVSRELLYTDDRVVMTGSLEECIANLKAWKEGMELEGLSFYIKKTKHMVSGSGLDLLRDTGAFPCGKCKHLMHKKCSCVS